MLTAFMRYLFVFAVLLSLQISAQAEAPKFKLSAQDTHSGFEPSNIGIIGVKYLHKIGEMSTVIEVYPHTPAEASGIHVGDRILEVDGTNIIPFTADQVFSVIAGHPGVPVGLKMMRCNHDYGTHLGCHTFMVNLRRIDMNELASDNVYRVYKYGN